MPTPCDPLFQYVVLLLNMEGANGGTVFTDDSQYNHTITQGGFGGITTQSAVTKWPPTAANFPPTNTNPGALLKTPYAAEFSMVSGDWCIEFWAKLSTTMQFTAWYQNTFTSLYPLQLFLDTTGIAFNCADPSGATVATGSWGTPIADGLFHHYAVVRNGSLFTLYVDGVSSGGSTSYPLGGGGYAGSLSPSAADISIGPIDSSGSPGDVAIIAGVRATIGVARYTAPFTPPPGPFDLACPNTAEYPDLTGLTFDAAQTLLATTVFAPLQDPPTFAPNAGVAVGLIFQQSPTAHSQQLAGTVGRVTISTGTPSDNVVVPLIQKIALTPAEANATLLAAGLVEGAVGVSTDPSGTPGTVFLQAILAGSIVPRGTSVPYTVSSVLQPFDPSPTVISQYANSPTILQLIGNMTDYLRPDVNFEAFYNFVWNVDTAQGFGLDIWGKIVGISRLLKIAADSPVLGFENADVPADWSPFNQGTFYTGELSSNTYILPDPAYRTLILTKALSNIVATTAASLNRLLRNLFPNRGKCYVIDLGGMAMQFVFEFSLSPVEFAILTQSGALPHPAGVSFTVVVTQTGGNFGFAEQGGQAQPFDQGIFFA